MKGAKLYSLKDLPRKNVRGYSGRAFALALFASIMAASVFGGTMMMLGARGGLTAIRARLGADIVVTPEENESSFGAQTMLVHNEPGYFYMDVSKMAEVAAVDGVDLVSPQLCLASSAESGCCTVSLQLTSFDPATDFSVQPWIEEAFGTTELGDYQVIVGNNVYIPDGSTTTLFNHECEVVGQFARTGTALDDALYMNFDTCRALTEQSIKNGVNLFPDLDVDNSISVIMVKVEPGADVETVAQTIRDQVDGVEVATASGMISGVAESLEEAMSTVPLYMATFWLAGLVMTVLVSSMTARARKREYATMRACGASNKAVRRVVVTEALLVTAAGALTGVLVAAVLLYSFKRLVGEVMGMGFVMPGVSTAMLVAMVALASVLVAAVASAAVTVAIVGKADQGLALREGE